jgi:hypothetical protein
MKMRGISALNSLVNVERDLVSVRRVDTYEEVCGVSRQALEEAWHVCAYTA